MMQHIFAPLQKCKHLIVYFVYVFHLQVQCHVKQREKDSHAAMAREMEFFLGWSFVKDVISQAKSEARVNYEFVSWNY